MKKKLSEERIVGVLKHVEMGVPMAELIRKIEITEQTYHRWKAEYAGLESIMSGRLSNYSTVHCFHILAYNPAVLFQRPFSLNGYPFLPSNFVHDKGRYHS